MDRSFLPGDLVRFLDYVEGAEGDGRGTVVEWADERNGILSIRLTSGDIVEVSKGLVERLDR